MTAARRPAAIDPPNERAGSARKRPWAEGAFPPRPATFRTAAVY